MMFRKPLGIVNTKYMSDIMLPGSFTGVYMYLHCMSW